ncbi:MAG TPA: metallopeptidase TldD-related protein [Anaerolineae bacterium]|nr:metallopeptidase TldD-related protein [Anaerolineae bacterium]
MNKEHYTHHVEEISLSVVQTRVDSIRKKDVLKTGIRVYDGARIGVAGAIGRYDEAELTGKAVAALDLGIPYPYELATGHQETVEPPVDLPHGTQFVDEMQAMLAELEQAQPGFSFSNKINLRTQTVRLANDLGLDLTYRSTSIEAGLIVKDRGSSNILDAIVGYDGWRYDRAEFLRFSNMICDAYRRPEQIDDGPHPVLFLNADPTTRTKLAESLNGQLYGTGASLFSGKIGERLFADRFTVYESKSWGDGIIAPFFDAEGTVSEGHRRPLIQDGVLVALRTDKKNAARFDLPLTGSAIGEYDSVPALGHPLAGAAYTLPANTGQTMKELLDGRKGVLVLIASGGDFTPDGRFATPVQLAYLFDGERLLGRLPELTVSSHLYDMFGPDFIGVSTDSLTTLANLNLIAMNMEVTRSG